jgi:RimK family alpha-L-glutamate ligase
MFFTDLKQVIKEQRRNVVVFTFGRFQPPTSGHELLINKVIKEAKKRKGEHRIYTSRVTDKRNPLNLKDKLHYMRRFFPQANIIDDPEAINAFTICQQLSDQGYRNVVLVVGSDRVREFKNGIEKYIGPDGYDFDSFEVISAGERDPDSQGVAGMSASKMRLAVSQNDLKSFISGMPSKASKRDTQKLFDILQKSIGVNESMINESIRRSQLKTIAKDKEVKSLLKAIHKEPHETIAIALLSMPSVEHIIGPVSDKTIKNFMKVVPDLINLSGIHEDTYTPRHPLNYLHEVKDSIIKDDGDIVVITLTKGEGDESSDTVTKLESSCKKKNIPYHTIKIGEAYVVDDDLNDNKMIIYNYDGDEHDLEIKASNTCCFVRGGSLVGIAGQGLIKTLEEAGVFMINRLSAMEQCQNKFSTSIALQKEGIPHPKTALVTNEESIKVVHKKIGGKFPVVIKTITGAEGIGVMIVDSMSSMKSVLQGLWKFNAELILQEYMPIEFDVRTLVLDGEVFASVKRRKSNSNDFRTNKALGNETEPYILNKEEKKLILQASESSGCYYCGVDHVVVDGKLYVLEVNGSPGSGASAYMSYYGDSDKKVSGKTLIDNIVNHIRDTDNWKRIKKTVGVIEYATIEGMELKCKLDTGNGSFNVIHAESINKLNNNRLSFTFNNKKFVKKIIKTQDIRFGGDESEKRFVVEVNMSMNGEKPKLVPFTLDDRSDNVYSVLIGKRYLAQKNYVVDVDKKFTLKGRNKDK